MKPIERPQVLIFDVNESMLDLSGMASEINKSFHDESAFKRWFSLMLQYSLVDNVTGRYHDFGKIGDAAMRMTAQLLGKEISESGHPTAQSCRAGEILRGFDQHR